MKYLKKKTESFYNFIYDSSLDIKDRTFVVFSVLYFIAVVAALVVGLFLKEPLMSTLTSLGVVVVSMLLLNIIIRKGLYKPAKIVVGFIMIFVFQPAMFITKV